MVTPFVLIGTSGEPILLPFALHFEGCEFPPLDGIKVAAGSSIALDFGF
jgi:hypothetical protein